MSIFLHIFINVYQCQVILQPKAVSIKYLLHVVIFLSQISNNCID